MSGLNESPVTGIPASDMTPLNGDTPQTPPPAQQTPANGSVPSPDLSKIDWATVDPNVIPESVLKSTKWGKEIMTETVSRRQEIKALKDAQAAAQPNQPQAQTPAKDDTPEWAKQLMARMDSFESANRKTEKDVHVKSALEKYNLPPEAAQWLTGSDAATIQSQAEQLAKTFLTPQTNGAMGNGQTFDRVDRMKAAITNRIKGAQGPIDPIEGSLFNPQVQDRVG